MASPPEHLNTRAPERRSPFLNSLDSAKLWFCAQRNERPRIVLARREQIEQHGKAGGPQLVDETNAHTVEVAHDGELAVVGARSLQVDLGRDAERPWPAYLVLQSQLVSDIPAIPNEGRGALVRNVPVADVEKRVARRRDIQLDLRREPVIRRAGGVDAVLIGYSCSRGEPPAQQERLRGESRAHVEAGGGDVRRVLDELTDSGSDVQEGRRVRRAVSRRRSDAEPRRFWIGDVGWAPGRCRRCAVAQQVDELHAHLRRARYRDDDVPPVIDAELVL